MVVGYARVSTVEQNIERQEVALQELGCERIYIDKLTGATLDRPEFNKMMDFVRDGDTLIVSEYNRLSRSTMDLLTTLGILEDKGVVVKSMKENLDTSTPQGKLMLTIFAGKYKGRKPKEYDQVLLNEVLNSLANNCMTVTEASKKLGVTRATVYNLLKKIGGTEQ